MKGALLSVDNHDINELCGQFSFKSFSKVPTKWWNHCISISTCFINLIEHKIITTKYCCWHFSSFNQLISFLKINKINEMSNWKNIAFLRGKSSLTETHMFFFTQCKLRVLCLILNSIHAKLTFLNIHVNIHHTEYTNTLSLSQSVSVSLSLSLTDTLRHTHTDPSPPPK